MDLVYLTKLIIEKFEKSEGYSELKTKELSESILKCLELQYAKECEISATNMELEKKHLNKEISDNKYFMEIRKIENNILHLVDILSASSKKDLQNLI